MRRIASALVLAYMIHPFGAARAETCKARFWCLSLRFQFTDNTFYFTTALGGVNGELSPGGGTYHTTFTLNPLVSPTHTFTTGPLLLDLPTFVDANGNGFDTSSRAR